MTKKTIERASADVGLIFTAYNLRRIINILDFNLLQDFLRELVFILLSIINTPKVRKLKNTPCYIFAIIPAINKDNCPKSLFLTQNLTKAGGY